MDIETRPSLAYVWSLWDENIPLDRLVESGEVICLAAKWLGERKVEFYSVHRDGRERMVREAHRLFDEADVLLHYNGKRFDVPHMNRCFVEAGLPPPSPYAQIDLYGVVKRQFRFPSNKLAHVAPALGLGGKVKHSGFDLWVRCMAGDDKAWREMEKYNRRDVTLLEELYERLLPWIDGHPNRRLYDSGEGCPQCGKGPLIARKHVYTSTGEYTAMQCKACGKYSRCVKRERGVAIRQVAG